MCNCASPRISAIELVSYQIGDAATEILQRLMNRAVVPKRTRKIWPLRIRPRESTDLIAIDDEELARALRFIRSNADQGITVANIVRASHISRRGQKKRFRDLVQRTPAEAIRQVRFEMVQRLLLDTNDTFATKGWKTFAKQSFPGISLRPRRDPLQMWRLITAASLQGVALNTLPPQDFPPPRPSLKCIESSPFC